MIAFNLKLCTYFHLIFSFTETHCMTDGSKSAFYSIKDLFARHVYLWDWRRRTEAECFISTVPLAYFVFIWQTSGKGACSVLSVRRFWNMSPSQTKSVSLRFCVNTLAFLKKHAVVALGAVSFQSVLMKWNSRGTGVISKSLSRGVGWFVMSFHRVNCVL